MRLWVAPISRVGSCSVVRATTAALAMAASLQSAIEAQYEDIEAHLGRAKLAQLYALLDELIDLQGDAPQEETSDMTDTETTTTLIDAAA